MRRRVFRYQFKCQLGCLIYIFLIISKWLFHCRKGEHQISSRIKRIYYLVNFIIRVIGVVVELVEWELWSLLEVAESSWEWLDVPLSKVRPLIEFSFIKWFLFAFDKYFSACGSVRACLDSVHLMRHKVVWWHENFVELVRVHVNNSWRALYQDNRGFITPYLDCQTSYNDQK